MNYQNKAPGEVIELLRKNNVQYFELDYYAFPQVFGSTAGPHGGIGGQAMSVFTVEAYVCDGEGPTVYDCAGKLKFHSGKFDPLKKPKW